MIIADIGENYKRKQRQKSPKNQQFGQDLPVNGRLVADLEKLDDGREHETSEYTALLACVLAAITEAQNLLSKYD